MHLEYNRRSRVRSAEFYSVLVVREEDGSVTMPPVTMPPVTMPPVTMPPVLPLCLQGARLVGPGALRGRGGGRRNMSEARTAARHPSRSTDQTNRWAFGDFGCLCLFVHL